MENRQLRIQKFSEGNKMAVIKRQNDDRRDYLMDMYKLYHGHINSMLNYFLIVTGLIINAYVQCLANKDLGWYAGSLTASLGAFLALVFFLVHMRSRDLLETIENGLRSEELLLFEKGGGFLNAPVTRKYWFNRHKYQFPIAYGAFGLAFLGMALFASPLASLKQFLCR